MTWVTDFCLPRKFWLHRCGFFSQVFVSHSPLALFCKLFHCQNLKVKTCIKWLAGVPLGFLRNVILHSSLKYLKVILSIKACLELGLWSLLQLSVRVSCGWEMFCSCIFRVLKPYFCCVAFSEVLGYPIPQKLYETNLTSLYCGVSLFELLTWDFCGLLKMSMKSRFLNAFV